MSDDVEPLTTEEEARLRRFAASEPWQLPDRIDTIRDMARRLLATLDTARDAAPHHHEVSWGPRSFHEGYGKGVCEADGQPWPCSTARDAP